MRNVNSWGLSLLIALVGIVSIATAQQGRPGGPGGPGGGFGGGFGGGSNLLDIVRRDDVVKELELVDDQVTKLTAIREKVNEETRGQFQGLRDLSEEDRRAKFEELRKKTEEIRAAAEKEMDEVLLPAQRDRVRQIRVQMLLRGGAESALSRPDIAEALSIDDAQKEKLREAAEAAQKELDAETRKLREAARAKVLEVLTPEQKAKWEKMVGEPFEFAQPQGGPGGRGGQPGQGGRGGRGGQPGAGGRNGSI